MNESLVTIVVPVFNGERFIKRAIESVLTQTYGNFVLKIFDNCSTDRTPDIIGSFKDTRIEYIRNEVNIGMLPNWKKALDSASTKYVAVLFADDFYKPNFLEKTIQIFEANQNLALVSGGHEYYDENDRLLNITKREKVGMFSSKEYYKYIYSLREVPPPSETIMLNEAVKNAGGFDIDNLNWIVDADLYLRISKLGYGACHLDDILSCRREWKGNSTLSIIFTQSNIEDRYYILNKYYDNEFIDEQTKIDSFDRVKNVIIANLYINLLKLNFKEIKSHYNIFKNEDYRVKHSNLIHKLIFLSKFFIYVIMNFIKIPIRKLYTDICSKRKITVDKQKVHENENLI